MEEETIIDKIQRDIKERAEHKNTYTRGKTKVVKEVEEDSKPSADTSTGNGNIVGNIIITKTINVTRTKRVAYYLLPTTIKKIEKLARESNKGISEFLQEFLDIGLEKIKIE